MAHPVEHSQNAPTTPTAPMHEPRSGEAEQVVQVIQRTLRRRKKLMLSCAFVVVILVFVYNEITTPVYETASSMIFDEVESPVQARVDPRVRDLPMFNRLEELGSYSFALEVAQSLEPSELVGFPWPADVQDEASRQRILANGILENLRAFRLRESNVIRLQVEAHSAQLAALVANRAVEVFKKRNLQVEQEGTGRVRMFLEEQLEVWRVRLEDSEEALRVYKEDNDITSLDTQTTEILRRASDAEKLRNEAQSKRESSEKRLRSVQAKLEEQRGDLVPTVTDVGSAWTHRLQENLVELQVQYMDLKVQNYPPTHPKLQALENEIAETKASLIRKAEEIAAGLDVLDPLDQIAEYTREAANLQIEIQSYRAQEEALQQIVSTYGATLQDLPEQEFRLARLSRERDANWSTYSLLREKYAQVRLEEAENIPSMRIIDAAQVPTRPAKPRKKLNLVLGMLLGGLSGFGIAFVRESSMRVAQSAQEVANVTGWRVLASIPRIERISAKRASRRLGRDANNGRESDAIKRRLVSILEPESGAAEAFRVLRTQLAFLGFGDEIRTVLVTSNLAADGKSTIASNLAIGLASSGGSTLLIDAETRRPKLHRVFGCPREPGLTDLLEAQNGSPLSVVQKTSVENLELLCSGSRIETPHDNVAPTIERLRWRLQEIRNLYKFVVIDTPPVLLTHDTALLSSLVDGVVLVVNSKRFDVEMLQSTRDLLANAHANVLGVVVNDVESIAPYRYEYYSVQE